MNLPGNRLVLGTAQLGTTYGVANTGSSIGLESAKDIISVARFLGVTALETSSAYVESIGYLAQLDVSGFDVIAKVGRRTYGAGEHSDFILSEEVRLLKKTLRRAEIEALLIHNSDLLTQERGEEVCAALLRMKAKGDVRRIGVSVYSPDELEKIPCLAELDVIQAPLNVLDSRFVEESVTENLLANQLDLHARSIFLQGLLLMSESERPKFFDRWSNTFRELDQFAIKNKASILELCLQFALQHPEAKKIVVGVDSAEQLRDLVKASGANVSRKFDLFSRVDEELLDPRRWRI